MGIEAWLDSGHLKYVCDGLFMLRGYYKRQQRLKGKDRPLHMLQRLTKLFTWSSLLDTLISATRKSMLC